MSKEAMKLALEAYLCREMPAGTIIGDPKWWVPKIAMAIREALAEQPAQQEPVAWATQMGEYAHIKWGAKRPEYPVRYEVPLYTSPPPRKPLTDEEIIGWVESGEYNVITNDWASHIAFARAIEAAHGIKENT